MKLKPDYDHILVGNMKIGYIKTSLSDTIYPAPNYLTNLLTTTD